MRSSSAWASGRCSASSCERARRAHAGDDVLALRVEQEIAAGLGRAGQLVARERDARRRAGAEVAEHHLLDVDGRAPVVRDVVDAAVGHRALAQPGVEDGADGEAQLLLRILGERLARVDLVERAEAARDLAHVVHAQLAVLAHAGTLPGRGEDLLVALARDAAHDVAEHLDEAPVGVPREALVARVRGQAQHRLVIETEVQDRLEHARHRVARAGAHRHEQRVVGVAQSAAREFLEAGDALGHLLRQACRLGAARVHERDARLGGDREAGGNHARAEHARHLGDVRALAAQQHAHVARALGEVVHVAGSGCDRGHGPILEARGASHMRRTTCLGVVDYGHGAA